MKKEAVFIILLFLLSFTFIRVLPLPVRAAPGTVRVPQDFLTIQQAIDASASGGTILVAAKTYNENITVWKPLEIKGENANSTIIEQVGAFAICHITANNVNVSGFTLRGGSIGVWIDSCNYDSVRSTVITNNDDGMWVTFSYGTVVSKNVLTDNLFMGLYLEASNNTSIDGNTIASNTYGTYIQNSEDNSIYGNNISLNYADGIHAINSNHNSVFHNLISNNSLGTYLEGSNSNSIYENNLVDNLEQARAENSVTNSWDDGTHGNYWSNYTGADNNGDGIGDTPYIINQNNQDRYPLMHPWTNIAFTSISPSKNAVAQGQPVNISVSLENQGWDTQTTNVTVRANTTVIATFPNIIVVGRSHTTLNFTWQTGTFSRGNYVISAQADPVPGETDITDNTYQSWIIVTITGDINGDGTVNILDAIILGNSFLATPGTQSWNPNADLNDDGIVNILDAIILGNHFLQHYP